VREGVLLRLEVAIESSGGSVPLKYSEEDGELTHHAKVKFSGRTLSQFGQIFIDE
jgi:hypothetical protein